MGPAEVHGPFQGRTWLVTSTPLPPSQVHVMAGLRSFEARLTGDSQPVGRRRRSRPPPPPRSSSLRRIRGTVSETDLRRDQERPASPAVSTYSEDQARCRPTIDDQRPTFSTFWRPQVCETIDEDAINSPLDTSDDGDAEVEGLPETAGARRSAMDDIGDIADRRDDHGRSTTLASIDLILSSMRSLQVALEDTTTQEVPPPPPPMPPLNPERGRTTSPTHNAYRSKPHKTLDCHKSLEDMFSDIETLYDSLKGDRPVKTGIGIEQFDPTSQDEHVYANIKVIPNSGDDDPVITHSLPKCLPPKVEPRFLQMFGKLPLFTKGLHEADYVACSTPKLQNKRPMNQIPLPPRPKSTTPPVPEAQYDVPRPMLPIEAVYDMPRVTPVPAIVESATPEAENSSVLSDASDLLSVRANELFSGENRPSNPVSEPAFSSDANADFLNNALDSVKSTMPVSQTDGYSLQRDAEVSVSSSCAVVSIPGVASSPAARTVSAARLRAVQLLVGDDLRLPEVPTHNPRTALSRRTASGRSTPSGRGSLSGRNTPTREPGAASTRDPGVVSAAALIIKSSSCGTRQPPEPAPTPKPALPEALDETDACKEQEQYANGSHRTCATEQRGNGQQSDGARLETQKHEDDPLKTCGTDQQSAPAQKSGPVQQKTQQTELRNTAEGGSESNTETPTPWEPLPSDGSASEVSRRVVRSRSAPPSRKPTPPVRSSSLTSSLTSRSRTTAPAVGATNPTPRPVRLLTIRTETEPVQSLRAAVRGSCDGVAVPVRQRAQQLQLQLGTRPAAADGRGSLGGCTRRPAQPEPQAAMCRLM